MNGAAYTRGRKRSEDRTKAGRRGQTSVRPSILRRARLALFGWVVFLSALVWLADAGRGQRLFGLVRSVPGGDKAGHFILFGTLAFLVNLVMQAAVVRCGRLTVLKGSVIVMLFVTAEELSQLFFASRTFEFLDLGADLVGIWLFGQLARRYLKHERVLAVQVARPVQCSR
jgi:hypothetical protein